MIDVTHLTAACDHLAEITEILQRASHSKALTVNVEHEIGVLVADCRRANRGESTNRQSLAIVADDGNIIGLLTGALSGHALPGDGRGAFVQILVVDDEYRRARKGADAVRAFAALAYRDGGSTVIGAKIDEEVGDVAGRQRFFERLGFVRDDNYYVASIAQITEADPPGDSGRQI